VIPELGTIEGFYGNPWPWELRAETVALLAPHGYRFYLYAPKGDAFLRRRWQEPHPEPFAENLAAFAAGCREHGVRFGIGLSPYEIYRDFNDSCREALRRKLDFFDRIGVEDLAILFDDMRGDLPGLAESQLEIVHWVQERASATRLLVCPTYYSDDPVLDRVFGQRPPTYLEELGRGLDASVEMFWTGEEVCSRELSVGHLRRVAEELGRKPFLWDNYPVNDGQRMSRYLHLRAFTGRHAGIAAHIAAHGVNPALQPVLSRVPMLTLPLCYMQGNDYAYLAAFRHAAREVLGPDLADRLAEDLLILQDIGVDRLDEAREKSLRERWSGVDHPAAREIVGWLDGDYAITDEIVHTQ
jgi:hyaluronoglucosaminidase